MNIFILCCHRRALGLLTFALCFCHMQPQADELLLDKAEVPIQASETTEDQARGMLVSVDQATLSSDLAGRIVEMPFREGESFKKGDLLVRFDCAIYQAQLAAAKAAARAAETELSQHQQLAQMKSVGRHTVALSAARFAQAQAESQVYQIQVDRCRIVAPFDGQMVKRRAQKYETLGLGMPVLEIVNNHHLEINLLVSSRKLSQLRPGQQFTFTPDETGKPLPARVTRLGAKIDESSQTLNLIGVIDAQYSHLMAGMSGTAHFPESH